MRIEYHKSFKKKFIKLDHKIRQQFRARLALFMQDKFHVQLENHSVEPRYPNCRSIRITGDYRAIFYQKGEVVTFLTIGTHSQLY